MIALSSLADNPPEGLYNSKCKDCKSYLEYLKAKDKLLIFKCLKCNKSHKKYLNKDLVEQFANT